MPSAVYEKILGIEWNQLNLTLTSLRTIAVFSKLNFFESTFEKYVNFESIFEKFVISKKMSMVDEVTININPYLIIDSYPGEWSGRPPRPKQRVGSDRPWHKESHDMRDSVWDGLWRPGGAFFQIGLGCVMSHPTEGLCAFLF